MQFGQSPIEVVSTAATLHRLCEHCGNATEHVLVKQPHGIGIGIPFASKPLWSSHVAFALMCPTCSWGEPLSKDIAEAMIRRGKTVSRPRGAIETHTENDVPESHPSSDSETVEEDSENANRAPVSGTIPGHGNVPENATLLPNGGSGNTPGPPADRPPVKHSAVPRELRLMNCDACDEKFDESQTKVFKGRKVCQICFAILSGKQGHAPAIPSTAGAPPPPKPDAPSSSSSQLQTTRAQDRLESEENGETPAEKTAPKPEASPTPVSQLQATQSKGKVEPTQKRRTAVNESKTRPVETKIGADRQAAEPKDTNVGKSVNTSRKENQATAKVHGTASSQKPLPDKQSNYSFATLVSVSGAVILIGAFFVARDRKPRPEENTTNIVEANTSAVETGPPMSNSRESLDAVELQRPDQERSTNTGDTGLSAHEHTDLAIASYREGDFASSNHHYRKAIASDPGNWYAVTGLAWLLATCPNSRYRNGSEAVALSNASVRMRLKTKQTNWPSYGTLAASYAEVGSFKKAVELQEWCIGITPVEYVEAARERLALYKSGKPYRTKPGPSEEVVDLKETPQPEAAAAGPAN